MSENDEKNCEFCGAEMVFLRGEANGLSCPNAFLHEEEMKIMESELRVYNSDSSNYHIFGSKPQEQV
jgi:hypothetical protein